MYQIFFMFAVGTFLAHAGSSLVQIHSDEVHRLTHALQQKGFDVAGHHAGIEQVSVVTDNPGLLEEVLRQLGSHERLHANVKSVTPTAPYRDLLNEALNEENYLDTDQTIEQLRALSRRFPQWAHLVDLSQLLDLPPTADGRALFALQVSENPQVIEDESKVLYIGQHHARELMTHHIVLDGARDLLEGAGRGDAKILSWLKDSAIWFVPVVNPDGLAHVFSTDRMWRKNRAANEDGSFGVDLNRNYDFKWGECGMHSTEGDSEVFKGSAPNSEPEVQVMDKLNAKLRVQYLLTFHSYGDEVLYPYLCGTVAETDVYYGLRDQLAETMGYRIRHASSSGEDFEHHYARYGSLSFLLEVGADFQPKFSYYKEKIAPVIGKSLPFVMEQLHSKQVHFKVTDALSGEPLSAGLRMASIAFAEGEVRETDAFGSYRWVLNQGNYEATFGAPGYLAKTLTVKASGRMDFVSVELEPSPLFSGFFRMLSAPFSGISSSL